MSRVKKVINIGDMFSTWEVVSCANPKKQRYLCRCSCGDEKEFIKYDLLKGTYAPCKKCGYKSINNIPEIKLHWNGELNGKPFLNISDFNLNRKYWFICNHGHNFKSNLKNFSLNNCLSCKNRIKDNSFKTTAVEYALQLFRSVFDDVRLEKYGIIIEDLKLVLVLLEHDRFKSHRYYYHSEEEYIQDITSLQNFKSEYSCKNYDVVELNVFDDFQKNVDSMKDILYNLVV